jgi:small basic protein
MNKLVLVIVFLFSVSVQAEDGTPRHIDWGKNNSYKAHTVVWGVNAAFGCLKAGIGQLYHGNSFVSGCAKGMMAGSLAYMGEYMATYLPYNTTVGLVGRYTHDLGISMSDNVMQNKGIIDSFTTDVGPFIVSIGKDINVSLSLISSVGLLSNVVKGYKFDLNTSLKYMSPVFQTKWIGDKDCSADQGCYIGGLTLGNVITYSTYLPESFNEIMSHEYNHTLFYRKMQFGNSVLDTLTMDLSKPPQEFFSFGRDGMMMLSYIQNVAPQTYYYTPMEINAYWMEK